MKFLENFTENDRGEIFGEIQQNKHCMNNFHQEWKIKKPASKFSAFGRKSKTILKFFDKISMEN